MQTGVEIWNTLHDGTIVAISGKFPTEHSYRSRQSLKLPTNTGATGQMGTCLRCPDIELRLKIGVAKGDVEFCTPDSDGTVVIQVNVSG